jgi:hypothetical protein
VNPKVLELERPSPAIFYGSGLAVPWPDRDVAKRRDRLPADPLSSIDHVRGAAK